MSPRPSKPKHLWQYKHPYYCSGGCYFATADQVTATNDSWSEFMEDGFGTSDEDYNMLMRWDWNTGEDHGLKRGEHQLELFFFLQRKAYPFTVRVRVTPADEPAVREWLAKRWSHTQRLWAPFSGVES